MTSKNWQARGRLLVSAIAAACLLVIDARLRAAGAVQDNFAPTSYIGSMDPHTIWEMVIGGFVGISFLSSIVVWTMSALRKAKRSQLRRSVFVNSALNNLSQGVVMTDKRHRIVFCNDRYLSIYGLARSDIPKNMTGPQLLELRRRR